MPRWRFFWCTLYIRQLHNRKCIEFYWDKLEASTLNPRRLWNTVNELLGRGRVPESSTIDVEAFQPFFLATRWSRVLQTPRAVVRSRASLYSVSQRWRLTTRLTSTTSLVLYTSPARLVGWLEFDGAFNTSPAKQVVRCWSAPHFATQTSNRQLHLLYSSSTGRWPRGISSCFQRGFHNTNRPSEEARTRWYGRFFLSANFQFDGFIKTLGSYRKRSVLQHLWRCSGSCRTRAQ